MKIGSMNLSWSLVLPFRFDATAAKKGFVVDNSFSAKSSFKAFTPHGASKDLIPQEHVLRDLDLELLREIAKGVENKNLSYQGFISSQLQHGPVDDQTKLALARAMAVKRMVALVHATIEEMRTIELRRISFTKG